MTKYYPGEKLGNYQKKGKGKLPLFCGNVERVIPIYGAQQTLKNTTWVGIIHAVHPSTRWYKTDIIHGYNDRRLNTKMYFDTLLPKFRSLNGNTFAQLFTDTEFI